MKEEREGREMEEESESRGERERVKGEKGGRWERKKEVGERVGSCKDSFKLMDGSVICLWCSKKRKKRLQYFYMRCC